jgi:hypothetical protein
MTTDRRRVANGVPQWYRPEVRHPTDETPFAPVTDDTPLDPRRSAVAFVTSPPEADGWRATYAIGVVNRTPCVIGVLLNPPNGAPGYGLTSRQARQLIRPAEAVARFRQATMNKKQVVIVEGWRVEETTIGQATRALREAGQQMRRHIRGFEEWVRRLSAHPTNRRQRIAMTAALYVRAQAEGHPRPRKRVAEIQGRPDAAVRDDLYRARHENPPLLTDTGVRGRSSGELTDAGWQVIKEVQAAQRSERRKIAAMRARSRREQAR